MTQEHIILPAEWHPQSGVQLTWPHEHTDWAYMLDEVEDCFINIAREIVRYEPLLIVTPYPEKVKQLLIDKMDVSRITFFCCLTNDTWARDHGAITVLKNGEAYIYDFAFNGWGLKFPAHFDNLITSRAHESSLFNARYENRLNFILEGGSIESDGEGTLLTTSECLLSPNRNGEWNRKQIEEYLMKAFGLKQILWLDYGYLAGDDTDSHIDTVARLAPCNTILCVRCTDIKDEHYDALLAMEKQLKNFRTLEDKPYRLLPLPMPKAICEDNERLPATYTNFLVLNGAVLYPTYGQPDNDRAAGKILETAFPGYDITGIPCTALIKQHGSLHCVTMQYPQHVLKNDYNEQNYTCGTCTTVQ